MLCDLVWLTLVYYSCDYHLEYDTLYLVSVVLYKSSLLLISRLCAGKLIGSLLKLQRETRIAHNRDVYLFGMLSCCHGHCNYYEEGTSSTILAFSFTLHLMSSVHNHSAELL